MSNRADYWTQLVGAWAKSGLTQAEFCRRRSVKTVTFAWWKRKLRGTANRGQHRTYGATASRRRTAAEFAELVLPDRVLAAGPPGAVTPGMPPAGYEIVLANGSLIRLPGDFDPEKVSQLLGLVAPPC